MIVTVLTRRAGVLLALPLIACAEPIEFRDWTTSVPESVPVIERAHVPLEMRRGRILEVVEDLRFGGDERPEHRFYRALGLGVSEDGSIWVFDAGNYRIQQFDADGTYRRTIGGRGEGPGEIGASRGHFAVAGAQLVLGAGYGNLSVWDRVSGEGTFRGQASSGPRILWQVAATSAGNVIAIHQFVDPATEELVGAIGRVTPDDYLRFSTLPRSRGGVILRRASGGSVQGVNTGVPVAVSDMAVAKYGGVYFTAGEEYQIFHVTEDGDWRWALRTDWQRIALSEEDVTAGLQRARRVLPDALRSEVEWPAEFPALAVPSQTLRSWARGHPLRVDAAGNVYVFPFVRDDARWNAEDRPNDLLRPVDVYSPEGELLFAGMMQEISWLDAHGDHVYGLEMNPATEEQQVVRYRLRRPF